MTGRGIVVSKRELVLSLLGESERHGVVPAGFFIHFDEVYHHGQAAIDKHLEFFRYTGMDFVKVQFENPFPLRTEIQRPGDWVKMPVYGLDFYENQLRIVEGLVKEAGQEALVIMTLYSPFMCAGQTVRHSSTVGHEVLTAHIVDDPGPVEAGIESIAQSLMLFVRECVSLGVDGFYASTQGGESHRFEDPACFQRCIKPYDLAIMEEMDRLCTCNILHVCDYFDTYADLTPFLDYPGHVVNCSTELENGNTTGREISEMFGRPFMGGMDRKGALVSGTQADIEEAVAAALEDAPDRFILGADCTLPGDISWDRIRTAISAAHDYGKTHSEEESG